jgi:8-oxo-dGTP pyrophosphatase MutT (NUDIX family)
VNQWTSTHQTGSPEAAVAIVEARIPEDSVLLVRRSDREEDSWSGHWCLPGGRRERQDPDLLHTAVRELEEECSLTLKPEQGATALPHVWARRHIGRYLLVAPFLFQVDRQLATVLDPREAADALWIPLRVLRDPARHALRPVPGRPAEVLFPGIELTGAPLWGFTYRLLTNWLGLWPQESTNREASAAAAECVLDFLIRLGLTANREWQDREFEGRQVRLAEVREEIPAAAVLSHFSTTEAFLPAVNALEVRADYVRMAGSEFEEYVIRVT